MKNNIQRIEALIEDVANLCALDTVLTPVEDFIDGLNPSFRENLIRGLQRKGVIVPQAVIGDTVYYSPSPDKPFEPYTVTMYHADCVVIDGEQLVRFSYRALGQTPDCPSIVFFDHHVGDTVLLSLADLDKKTAAGGVDFES